MVEQYLNEKYNKTKFPFVALPEIINRFSEEGLNELNRMKDDGKVKRRMGINNILIQLLVTIDGEIINEI